jgi:Tfp pilus assembly protein PilV
MRRLVITVLLIAPALALAQVQNRSAELEQAYQETRAAFLALQAAEQRRNEGIESQAGERQGTAAGGASRPTENYFARQAQLDLEVEQARKRYETAAKRWNDLK